MPYIEAQDRNQMMMCSLDWTPWWIRRAIARVIDKFVHGLDLRGMGFDKVEAATEGRPSYDPRSLLKLYLYRGRKKMRLIRKLEEACRLIVEVKWLMSGTQPDFRTISDLRKDNIECLKKVFHEFNRKLSEVLTKEFIYVDGSKFQADNPKDNNFTANKLDDRIEWLDRHTDKYLRQLADMVEAEEDAQPGELTREELATRLKAAEERVERYRGYGRIWRRTACPRCR